MASGTPKAFNPDEGDEEPLDEPTESIFRRHARLLLALLAAILLAVAVMAGWSMGPFPQSFEARITICSISGLIALAILGYLVGTSAKAVKLPRLKLRKRKAVKVQPVSTVAGPSSKDPDVDDEEVVEPVKRSVHTLVEAMAAYESIELTPPDPTLSPAAPPVTLVATAVPSTPTVVATGAPGASGVVAAMKITGVPAFDGTPESIEAIVAHLMGQTDLSMREIFDHVEGLSIST